MTPSDDSQLIERCRNGDREAFDELVRRYERQAYNLAYRLAGNYDDASDVVVEAFVRAFQGLHTFRGDANFGTWLHRVVVNTFLDMRKRSKGRQHVSLEEQLELDGDTLTRQIEDTSPGPQELVEQEEREEERPACAVRSHDVSDRPRLDPGRVGGQDGADEHGGERGFELAGGARPDDPERDGGERRGPRPPGAERVGDGQALAAARERIHAHESEAERRRHLELQRERLLREWDALPFDDLQAALRDVVDRIEVDGDDVRVYRRV